MCFRSNKNYILSTDADFGQYVRFPYWPVSAKDTFRLFACSRSVSFSLRWRLVIAVQQAPPPRLPVVAVLSWVLLVMLDTAKTFFVRGFVVRTELLMLD